MNLRPALARTTGTLALTGLLLAPSTHSQAVTVLPTPPVLDNKAYVLMDHDSGQILAAVNPDQELPPASMTKMMTSYLIEQRLMHGQLREDEPVRMNESAWCRGSSSESCMYVPLNGTATVLQMLRGIVIQSGNDASKAMAEHIAGNEGAFAELMNAEAKKLGMNHTHFMNATGLPMPGHYSSARDMAILAQAIIRTSAKYYPIYSEKEFTFNNIKQGNRNALLYTDPTVDGLKTGHTEEAGYCLVASSKRGNMRLISVIFGTPSMNARAQQSRELLNWGFANYETTTLRPAGQSLATAPIWLGQKPQVSVGLAQAMVATLPKGSAQGLTTQLTLLPDLKAPIQKGQVIGQLTAKNGSQVVAQQPVVALEAVEQAGWFARLIDQIKLFFSRWF